MTGKQSEHKLRCVLLVSSQLVYMIFKNNVLYLGMTYADDVLRCQASS